MEHYAVLKQMKEHWDFSYGQHQELAQRYIPNNIEVVPRKSHIGYFHLIYTFILGKPACSSYSS